jgi:type IV pilus assembly protein PilY1
MPNGEFAVVVTSGLFDSAQTGGGKIWVLNAATGAIIETFTLASGQLGSPLAVDLDNDRIVDRIYVGDSEGQLWRIDTEGTDASQWGVPASAPLFAAPDGQTITAPLASAFNEKGEHMVFFGTGSYIREGDNVVGNSPDIQSFYGIIDRGLELEVDDLLEQDILARVTVNGNSLGALSNNQIESQDGWYINLVWKTSFNGPGPDGERATARALVRGDRVIFTTLIPSADACSAGGTGLLYEVDTQSGGRLAYAVFDLNNDGKFDENDFIEISDGDGGTITIPPTTFNPDIGLINTPTVLVEPNTGDERKIFTGSSGQIISVPEAGSISRGRQNWEQIR